MLDRKEGRRTYTFEYTMIEKPHWELCAHCSGRGWRQLGEVCPRCSGLQKVQTKKTFTRSIGIESRPGTMEEAEKLALGHLQQLEPEVAADPSAWHLSRYWVHVRSASRG